MTSVEDEEVELKYEEALQQELLMYEFPLTWNEFQVAAKNAREVSGRKVDVSRDGGQRGTTTYHEHMNKMFGAECRICLCTTVRRKLFFLTFEVPKACNDCSHPRHGDVRVSSNTWPGLSVPRRLHGAAAGRPAPWRLRGAGAGRSVPWSLCLP